MISDQRQFTKRTRLAIKAVIIVGLAGVLLVFFFFNRAPERIHSPARVENIPNAPKEKEMPPPPPPPSDNEATNSMPGTDAVIRGIDANSIKLSLEKWGLEFTGPVEVEDANDDTQLYLDTGRVSDPDTGIALSCNIITTSTLQVAAVKFKVDGLSVAESLPAEKYLSEAESFLEHCAALPYEHAEPVKTSMWVKENVRKVKPGKPAVMVVNSVEYQLSADKYMRLLSIRPKK